MFCQNCGTKRESTERFCANCGSAFQSEAGTQKFVNASTRKNIVPIEKENKAAEKTLKGFATFILIVGMIALVGGLGWGIHIIMTNDPNAIEEVRNTRFNNFMQCLVIGVGGFVLALLLWAMLTISAKKSSMLVDIKYMLEKQFSNE